MGLGMIGALSNMMGLSTVLSGLGSIISQRQTNKSNAALADKQMAFQSEMSGTAYQRAVKDMMAAGINPMLASQVGGASTPPGAMAKMENEVAPGVASALQSAQVLQSLQGVETSASQSEALQAQADKVRSETMDRNLNSAKLAADIVNTNTSSRQLNHLADRTMQEVSSATYDAEQKKYQLRADRERGVFSARAGKAVADAEKAEYEAKSSQYGLSRDKAYADYYDTSVGRSEPYIGLGTDVLSSAAQLKRAFAPRRAK